ncbi:MAG: hypothetical protein LBG43_10350 [Treponema sp.]|jgi:hypothetical protein|nr:hypothetical protein [Treponema sp.]
MSDNRQQYLDKYSDYQSSIDTILAWKAKFLTEISEDDPGELALSKLKLANATLDLFSYYIILNTLSSSLLKKKNEDIINNARKSFLNAITLMEEVVSPFLDAPYGDYEDKLELIASFSAQERYVLVRKLGLSFALLKAAYGENPKWKWMLVDLEGRSITVTKNFIDLKKAVSNTDLRSPDYEPTACHLRLIKNLLPKGANTFRERYEIISHSEDDFKKSIDFLSSLRYLYSVLGEGDNAEATKRKIEAWNDKLKKDMKNKENGAA